MSETKITELVPQETIDKVKELNTEMQSLLTSYTATAKELAKGLDVNVKVVGDVDKLEKLFVEKSKEAVEQTTRLNAVIKEQGQVIANTTNTISRQLMEQERVNKTTRDVYTEYDRVKKLLEEFNGSYDDHIKRLMSLNSQLAANSKQQKDNEKALKSGRMSLADYHNAQADLIAQHRMLTQEKRTLQQIMTAEEKAMQTADTSYVQMSQQLELLKKAYKDLSVEARDGDIGREMEEAIQNLDAHLKDVAADMGEFQRNVGNYAIAGQNGVVSTESLMAALNQQAVTTKDVSDQSKILLEARSMLDTSDENYAQTVGLINDKLAENSRRLSDVSDIMDVQAKTIAEAEAQNKRLNEALKNVDLTSEGAGKTIAVLNAKIDENNRLIGAGDNSKESAKKSLRELVLEIANLTAEYKSLSEEEQKSAKGQALAQHIGELTEKAGVLKDAIADTNRAIQNASSDTRTFDQLSEGAQLATNSFGLLTTASSALGISGENLQAVQAKLVAVLTASNAMSKIQNTLQKESAIMQAVNLAQTKLRTVAENLHTAAQGKGIVTTKLLTAAQWAFNAAANANPIGLIVVAIVACTAAMYGLVKAFKYFFDDSEVRQKKYEQEAEKLNQLKKRNNELIENAKARGKNELEVAQMSINAKKAEMEQANKAFEAAVKAYKEDEEKYKEAVENKKTATEELNNTLQSTYATIQKYLATLEDERGKEKYGEELWALQQIENEYERIKKTTKQYYEEKRALIYSTCTDVKELRKQLRELDKQMREDTANIEEMHERKRKEQEKKNAESAQRRAQQVQQAAEKLKKEVEKGEDALISIIKDSGERQLAEENKRYERELAKLQEQLKKLKAANVKEREAINTQIQANEVKHQQKLEMIRFGNVERANKVEIEMLNLRLGSVEKGSAEEFELRKQLLQKTHENEINAIKKRVLEGQLTEEEGQDMMMDSNAKYYADVENAEKEHQEKMLDLKMAKFGSELDDDDTALVGRLALLKQQYADDLANFKGSEEEKAQLTKDYERRIADEEIRYAQERTQKTIDFLRKMLDSEELTQEDRLRLEKELARLYADLENQRAEAAIKANERIGEDEEDLQKKRLENTKKWIDTAKEALNQIGSLTSAIYDAKIEKVEKDQELMNEASEADIERITNLVEKQVITEEEGEARKRAAEEKTARKNEELERKKAEIKRRQAVFDKALSIANIGLNTAMALMQLWVKPGWPAAIPMMAVVGALGALQLAVALATPIPKYAMGTQNHPGGPAIVGDGGRPEIVTFGNNAWLTPDTPTLVNLPAGSSVFPSIMDYDDAFPGLVKTLSDGKTPPQIVVNNDYQKLEQKMDKVIYLFSVLNRSRKDEQTSAYIEILKAQKGL